MSRRRDCDRALASTCRFPVYLSRRWETLAKARPEETCESDQGQPRFGETTTRTGSGLGELMLLGFFCAAACALPAGQVSIGPGMDQGASLVQRDGAVIGRYIDDTYVGDPRALAARFRSQHVGMILIGTYGKPGRFGPGTTNVVEHYPVLDHTSTVTALPPEPRGSGYILQSFSWGDNLTDGITRGRCSPVDSTTICARRYAAPTVAQMRQSWCLARRTRASILLWYHYSAADANAVLGIERAGCTRWWSAYRSGRRRGRGGPTP